MRAKNSMVKNIQASLQYAKISINFDDAVKNILVVLRHPHPSYNTWVYTYVHVHSDDGELWSQILKMKIQYVVQFDILSHQMLCEIGIYI